MQLALDEVLGGKESVRKIAASYGIAESTIRTRMKKLNPELPSRKSGRRPVFSDEVEQKLATCVDALCKCGFSPKPSEILDLVKEFTARNGVATPFTNGRPGIDWLNSFMSRNKLTLKKANMISSARKSATSNPFLIYDFYETLDQVVSENGLNKSQIWNCDESAFPSDPQRCKVVSKRGKVAYKVTCGAGRQNTTVLACCCADGTSMPPLIIFSGKNLQSTWRGRKAVRGTQYAVSDNGWITGEIFADWFKKFSKQVKKRPLLLIFDGHLSHVSFDVISHAIDDNITLLKFPPHVTDVLQPLDVACFAPLKKKWEGVLNDWVNAYGTKEPMTRANFANQLGKIWKLGLSESNVISGFASTGVFPVDKSKYPSERFDKRLLKRYDLWVAAGKPEDIMEALATELNTPKKLKGRASNSSSLMEMDDSGSDTPDIGLPSSSLEPCTCDVCEKLGAKPDVVQPGKKWFPAWILVNEENPLCSTPNNSEEASTSSDLTSTNASFEELILEKMKGPVQKNAQKRRKIDFKAKVITDVEYAKAIAEKEQGKGKKERNTQKEKKYTGSPEEMEADSESEDSVTDDTHTEEELCKVWKSLSPPNEEKDIVLRWYACIYQVKRKNLMFIGRPTKRFLQDLGGSVSSLEIDCCIKPVAGSDTVYENLPSHLPKDVEVFSASDIIAEAHMEPLRGGKWRVKNAHYIKEIFDETQKIDRKKTFEKFSSEFIV